MLNSIISNNSKFCDMCFINFDCRERMGWRMNGCADERDRLVGIERRNGRGKVRNFGENKSVERKNLLENTLNSKWIFDVIVRTLNAIALYGVYT